MRRYLLIILSLIILTLAACGKSQAPADRYTAYDNILDYAKPLAFGEDNDVYVFCGKQNWQALESLLRRSIEREISLVYNERYFNLIPVELKRFNELYPYKNLVFIGDLNGTDDVSTHMRSSLPKDYLDRVSQTGGDLFISKNHHSRDQIILYLLGSDSAKLVNIAMIQSDNIFNNLLKRYAERLAYQSFRTKVISPDFWENYPFTMKVPNNYRLYSNDGPGRFLSLLYRSRAENREIPDKYISVYYETMQADSVSENWLFEKRNQIWGKYFEGDTIFKDKIRMERFKFAGYDGWRLIGPWENRTHLIGGAFQSFGFWHPESKRAYIVDNSVYFPAGDKLAILLELQMIARTLVIK
jgi:hypothetical protein